MHSMVLMSDGTVYTWGNNAVGQLGVGDKTPRLCPSRSTGRNVVISPAYEAGCGL